MADGTITFSTALDNSELEKQLADVQKKLSGLNRTISRLGSARLPLIAQARELGGALDAAKAKLYAMQSAGKGPASAGRISEQEETVRALQALWDGVQDRVERYDAAIAGAQADLADHEAQAGALGQALAETDTSGIDRADEKVSRFAGRLRQALGKSAKQASGLMLSAFRSVAQGIAKAAVRLNVFSKLTGSLKKLFHGLAGAIRSSGGIDLLREQMGKYLQMNPAFMGALARVKGALLTAFQPIYNAVVPALTALLNIVARVLGALAQGTAAMFGTTAEQAQENAGALYNQAEATGAAGEAAKDAEKFLAGFDEIDKFSGAPGGGGGGAGAPAAAGGAAPSFAMDLDEGALTSWGQTFDTFLDRILTNGVPRLQQGLSEFSDSVNRFSGNLLEMFTFPGVLETITGIGQGIAGALNGMVSAIDWNQLGSAVGAGLNAALALAVSFLYTFDWQTFGSSLAESVNGLVSQIDWYNFGALLFSGFKIALETLAGFLIGLDMAALAEAANDIAIGFFNSAAESLQGVDWQALGSNIGIFLAGIDWLGILEAVFEAIWEAVSGLLEGLWSGIQSYFENADLFQTVLGALAIAIGVVTTALTAYEAITKLAAVTTELFGSPITKIVAVIGALIAIIALCVTHWDEIKAAAASAWEGIKSVWETVATWFDETVIQPIREGWESLQEGFKIIWNGIIGYLEGAVNSIIQGLNWLIKQLNKIRFDIPDWVPVIGGKSFGINIPAIKEVEIPRLAAGAVIPPNREFLAVLGDQRSGTNVEAPLSAIEQAVDNALRRSGFGGGGETTVVLEVDGQQFGKVVFDANNRESRRVGVRLVEV